MKEPKVVFIDWAETLSTSKFWGHWAQPQHAFGDLYARIQTSLFAHSGYLAYLVRPWMKGDYTSEQIVEKLASELGVDAKVLFRELIESCKSMQFVSSEVPELVQSLRDRGIKVVIATVNMDCFDRWTVPAMSLPDLFDEILNSYGLKAYKEDRFLDGTSAFFGGFLEKHRIGPGESVLIDDSRIIGATIQSFGIEYRQIEPGIGLIPELKRILRQ